MVEGYKYYKETPIADTYTTPMNYYGGGAYDPSSAANIPIDIALPSPEDTETHPSASSKGRSKGSKVEEEEKDERIIQAPVQKSNYKGHHTTLKRKYKMKCMENRRKQKCLRKSGAQVWEDQSMDEWPDGDYRIFAGDLGNEVSDEVLATPFRKYATFQKAKVIRDKRTGKTKGYGFISIGGVEDYIRAMKEMQGKYVGNRPIRLLKSNWQNRALLGGADAGGNNKRRKLKVV